MLTLYDFHERAFTSGRPLWVACGVFDGVHRGHQALLRRARELAAAGGGRAVALSFSPHPLAVVAPGRAPALLTPVPLRLRLLAAAGAAGCVLLNFRPAMSAMAPGEFVEYLLGRFPRVRGFVVGADWRFGQGQAGDAGLLTRIAGLTGREVAVVPPVLYGDEKISSSRIRAALKRGDLEEAAAMLGRPFTVLGEVLHGRQIGRTLGAPTANLQPGGLNPLAPGSYAARATVDGVTHPASAYAGSRPTYQGDSPEYYVEVHLLDGAFDLYGREMTVEFLRFLRPEMKLRGPEELRQRIHADFAAARAYFAGASGHDKPQNQFPLQQAP